MRKKTARTPGTQASRDPTHQGLIAKADMPRAESASTECALDNRSHRTTLGFTCATNMPPPGREVQGERIGTLPAYRVRCKPLLGGVDSRSKFNKWNLALQ